MSDAPSFLRLSRGRERHSSNARERIILAAANDEKSVKSDNWLRSVDGAARKVRATHQAMMLTPPSTYSVSPVMRRA